MIEYGGPACSRYKEYFLPLISEGLQSKHPEVRQASSYAWGVLGKCAGEEFSQNVAGILPVLAGVINSDGSRDDVNLNATENAIAAVTKIIQYNSSKINLNEVLPVWLNWLPVYEDEEELPHVYGFLLFLLEKLVVVLYHVMSPLKQWTLIHVILTSSCLISKQQPSFNFG